LRNKEIWGSPKKEESIIAHPFNCGNRGVFWLLTLLKHTECHQNRKFVSIHLSQKSWGYNSGSK